MFYEFDKEIPKVPYLYATLDYFLAFLWNYPEISR